MISPLTAGVDARSQTGNATHHGVITALDDNALARPLHAVGGEEANVLGLKRVLVGALDTTLLGLGLAGQGGVVHLVTKMMSRDNP